MWRLQSHHSFDKSHSWQWGQAEVTLGSATRQSVMMVLLLGQSQCYVTVTVFQLPSTYTNRKYQFCTESQKRQPGLHLHICSIYLQALFPQGTPDHTLRASG